MAKISKSEDGKLLVDGKPFDAADYALSDDDLENVTGGSRVALEFAFGLTGAFSPGVTYPGVTYLTCKSCGSNIFDVMVNTNGNLTCICKQCRANGSICAYYVAAGDYLWCT